MGDVSEMDAVDKLRLLAEWFDVQDNKKDYRGPREVQNDLRLISDEIVRLRAEVERLREGMQEADELLADKEYLKYKADYVCRGHKSYYGMIQKREAKFRAALAPEEE